MVRGENIGGIKPATKDNFQIRKIRDKWKNQERLLARMVELYDKYNDVYNKELEGGLQNRPLI